MEITIGDIARQTGLATSAIRYYESIGAVPKPARKNGRRIYSSDWVKWLGIVMLPQEMGFSMQEIKQIVQQFNNTKTPPSKRWQRMAKIKYDELEEKKQQIQQMQQLLQNPMQCDCSRIEHCGEYALQNVIFK